MSDFIAIWERVCAENSATKYVEWGEQFATMCDLLLDFNSHTNLTAIKDEEGVAALHFLDSLLASDFIAEGARVLDVGCGGGFPSLPLALTRPDIAVTSLDSTAKKLKFIDLCAEEMGLGNISTICARAEEIPMFREKFDVCTARAVAPLNLLCELCIPQVKVGGMFVALKSRGAEEELAEAKNAPNILGATEPQVHNLSLVSKGEKLERTIIVYNKIKPTPAEYPRAWGKMKKKPL